MIRSILVPLDGSRFAEIALPLAGALAKRVNARIRLLAVHEPRVGVTPGLDVPALETHNLEVRQALRSYLDDAVRRVAPEGGPPVATEVVDGLPGPAVAEATARHRPDLLVMSTHGRGPVSRFWLGSVADHLIRHVTVPLLLTRPSDDGPATSADIQRILVALDLSAASTAILDVAGAVARAYGGSVTLLHVVEPIVGMVDGALPFPLPVDAGVLEVRKAQADAHLRELASRPELEGLDVSTRVTVGVGAAPTILDLLAKEGYDLVAMTTHGAGGMRRLLVGSVADKVIRGSEHPILLKRILDE